MKNTAFYLSCLLTVLLWGCGEKTQPPAEGERTLSSFFPVVASADTLHFEVANDTAWNTSGDTIPNRFFFSQLETHLMNEVPYFDNSGELVVRADRQFALTDSTEAYLVNMSQGWYRHRSLFLFDLQKQAFTDRLTVADFYGGDGGQLLTASYLLDFDGDGDLDLVRREMEHWLIMDDDENPRDTLSESASLLLWQDQGFKPVPSDTAALVRQLPMEGMW